MKGRIIAIGLAAGLVGAALGAERFFPMTESLQTTSGVAVSALLNPSTSLGSLWFCPLVSDTSVGPGTITVSRSRPASSATSAVATVTLHSPAGVMAKQELAVSTGSQRFNVIELLGDANPQDLPSLAAIVEVNEPGALVSASIPGSGGSSAPCSTAVGPTWWLGSGSTVLGSATSIALFNPFPESALVDLNFITDRGAAQPTDLQGLAVQSGAVRIIELGEFVRRREVMSTAVVARVGRIVVGQRQRIDGVGTALSVGSPELVDRWYFPHAMFGPKRAEQYVFTNPNSREIDIDVVATLDNGDVEPFAVNVPAQSVVLFDPTEDERIPEATSYSMTASVADGSKFVASLTSRSTSTPSATGGKRLVTVGGSARTSQMWLLDGWAASATERKADVRIGILNPYDVPTDVIIESIQPGKKAVVILRKRLLDGRRLSVGSGDLDDLAGGSTVRIRSTEAPIVVQQDIVDSGWSSTIAFVGE